MNLIMITTSRYKQLYLYYLLFIVFETKNYMITRELVKCFKNFKFRRIIALPDRVTHQLFCLLLYQEIVIHTFFLFISSE